MSIRKSSKNIIVSIETSCDETSVSVLRESDDGLEVLSNEISSQVKLHAKWGGVVPNLAAREHTKNITTVFELSLQKAKMKMEDVDLVAVTQGPGLIPALMVGTTFAKTLAYLWEKPLIGIHHIEGHIYANFINEISVSSNLQIPNSKKIERSRSNPKYQISFPALCLVVSGGHTQLVYMKDHLQYEIIGQTLDDAVGEAFDKVARILKIGYPGGPAIAQRAMEFPITKPRYELKFPRPMLNKQGFNFSFSGLKTAVLYETKKHPEMLDDKKYIAAICHEFQQAAIDVLVSKTIRAAEKFKPKTIMLAGGVSANSELRKQLGEAIKNNLSYLSDLSYLVPDLSLTGDNAAMIAAAAAFRWQKMTDPQKKKALDGWKTLQPDANLKLK